MTMQLVDLEMTKEEYFCLPHLSTLTDRDLNEIVPLGFRCKDSNGFVRELVSGNDMFVHQWGAGLAVPDRGWRYYNAKFVCLKPNEATIAPRPG